MDYQPRPQFGLEPGGFGRHDLAAVGDVHDLLHADGEESECSTHLTAVHTALEFSESTQPAYEVNAFAAAQVAKLQVSSRMRREEISTSSTPMGSFSS